MGGIADSKAIMFGNPLGDGHNWIQSMTSLAGRKLGSALLALALAVGTLGTARAADSVVRALDLTIARGETNRMHIVLEAQGTENAVGFSLCYDTNLLTFIRAVRGADSTNAVATLSVGTNQTFRGRVGFILGLDIPSEQVFPIGTHRIIEVLFRAAPGGGVVTTPVMFCDLPTTREVSTPGAGTVPTLYVDATVTLSGTCSFSLGTNAMAFAGTGGSNGVSVVADSGCAWSVSNPLGWVTIHSGASGTGNGTVGFSVAENPEVTPRSGVLTIAGQSFTVNQAGFVCAYTLSPTNRNHGSSAATNSFVINTGSSCAWTISTTNSWIAFTSATSGTGTVTAVTYTIQANTSQAERVGSIQVADQILTLRQSGINCAFSISPTNRTHGPGAATNTISVMANPACSWGLVNTNPWISFLSGAGGAGDGAVTYAITANPTPFDRMGVVLVAGEPFVVTQRGITCEFSLSPTNRNHGNGAATNSFDVETTTGCAWTVDNTNGWIVITSATNGSGTETVNYMVMANPNTVARTGRVFVAGQTFTLSQNPAACIYAINPSGRSHGAGPESGSLAVTTSSNCLWNVVNTNGWITIDSGGNGAGDGSVAYSLATNTSLSARSGVVVIAGKNFTINQAGASCGFTLTPTNGIHGASAVTAQVSVATSAACAWSVVNTNGWITILAGTNGTGNGTVTYALTANPDEDPRTGEFSIGGVEFSVAQAGACSYRVSPVNRNHGSSAATNTIAVTTALDCAWIATVTNNWMTLLSGASGPGTGLVTYAVAANTTPLERTGHVMVADQVLTLRQAGITCAYSLSPTNRNHGNGAATNSFNLTTSAACPWNVVNSNAWITITAAANGTGSVAVTYTVAANPDGFSRTGLIQVASQTFTLSQNPATCNFTLTPTSRSHSSAGETGVITNTGPNGCAWTASNTNSWINIISATSGTGPAVVLYSIETNSAPVSRSGVLVIGNRNFTVNQAAAPCAFTLAPTNGVHGAGAETGQVNVTTTANCSWSVSDTNDWIDILVGSGTGSGVASYAVEANLDTVARTGLVVIAGQSFSIVQAAGPCVYRISPVNRNHGSSAATNSIAVTASNNCPWSATTTNNWITLLAGASGSGTGLVSYAVAANGSPLERTGHVMVADQVLTLRQSGIVCSYSLSPTNRNHGYGAATNTFGVSTSGGCDWTATTTNDWLTILSGTSGSGNGTVTYTAVANPVPVGRTGQVQVADRVFTITQDPAPCLVSISPTTRTHGYSPATNSIALTTLEGCPWAVVNTSTWVTITSPANGTGSAAIDYTVAANTQPIERTALIQIANETFTLTQRAAPCLYELVPTNRLHSAISETGLISVLTFTNCSWTAVTTNSWITIAGAASNLGNGSVGYFLAANTNASPRNGYIDIGSETFRVTQAGVPCVFALTPTNRAHGPGVETGSVAVASAAGCDWSVDNTNAWIDIDTGHSGSGDGVVTYIVDANPLLTARSCVFTVAGEIFSVTQAGRVCAYRLSPTNRMHGHSAASNAFTVTASNDCAWVASTTDNWINVTGGASGMGNGTVNYSVSANPAPAERTGTILVAGQAFTLVQSAAPCTMEISPASRSHGPGIATNTVSLTTLAACPWTVLNTNSWLSITTATNGSGNALIGYTVAENLDAMERVGRVFIAGETLTLTQRAAVCTFTLSANNRTHGFGAATNSVDLTTLVGCAWTADNTNNWIAITSPTSGVGNATVAYTVEANPLTFWRTGVLSIAGELLTLAQRPAPCAFILTPTNGAHSHLAATALVNVATSGNCPWDATTTNAWLSITASATGLGNGAVTYTVEANPSPLPRTGALTIGDEIFPITQAGAPCDYTLVPASRSHGSGSETGSVSVVASNLCPWSVINSNTWINLHSPASSNSSGNVSYSVDENPAPLARSGYLAIAGQSFLVTQEAAECSYRLSPTNRTHGYGATTGSVNIIVLAGCNWVAGTTNEWISILSGGSGSSNGVVSYVLAENGTIVGRTGFVTVADQTLTVVQGGAPCTYAVSPATRTHGNGTVTNTITLTTLAGCPWTALNTNDWITFLSPTSGVGSATLQYMAMTNEVTVERIGVLLVAGETVTLTQRAAPCVFTLSAPNPTHAYMTETGQVTITTSANCPWSIENTNYWITFPDGTNGLGSGTVRYVVAVNMSAFERSASFFINGVQYAVNQAGSPCQYSISPTNHHHSGLAETGTVSVTVAGGCEWMTDNTNSWITVSSGLAGSGNGTVIYEVQANPTTFPRTGVVMIAGQNLTVSQGGSTCGYAISPSTRSFTHLAGSGSVSVNTAGNCPWTAVSTNDWVTITSPASSNGSGTVTYNVAANPTGMNRTGLVSIAGLPFTLTQVGMPCAYAIAPPSRNHGFGMETGTVTVTSAIGCGWTTSNANNWITILAGASGSSTGTVTYVVASNLTALARSGVLSIAGSTFTINQAAAPCTFAIAPTNVVHGYGIETGAVNVTTLLGCSWAVTNTNSWISFTTVTNGTNSAVVGYLLATNPVTVGRTGVLFIAGQRLTVVQDPSPCTYAIAPSGRSHALNAETGLVTVTTSSNCPWTVTNNNSWITITSGASRTGSGTIGYNVAANPTGLPRTGVLMVDGQTFTVSQAAAPCTYSLQTTGAAHGAAAGNGSITLNTLLGCPWSAVNTNTWLSLNAETNGTNSGVVGYLVAANPTAIARTGVVSVAGLAFTITQSGAACTFTLSDAGLAHGFNASTGSVDVTTLVGCVWSVNNPNAWITITAGPTRTNSGTVGYSVAANPTGLSRTGIVTIASQPYTVTQDAAPCTFSIAPSSRSHGFTIDTGTVSVTTLVGCPWTASTSENWLVILNGANSTNSGSISYRVVSNATAIARTGTVSVAGQTFTVTQSGAPCSYALSPGSRTHISDVGMNSFAVNTLVGCVWAPTTTNTWISIFSAINNTNSGTVDYAVEANPTALLRTGAVSVAGQTFTITQSGAACTFTLAPMRRNHVPGADAGTINVTTLIGCVWNPTTTNTWITVTGGASRTNSGVLTYNVAANPTGLSRTGAVSAAGQTFVVTQDAAPCTFSISPGNRSHGSGMETNSVSVTTLVGCPWTAASNDGWITILSGGNSTNSGSASYAVAPNPTANPRSGTLTVAGQTFTVNQAGAPCVYTLTPGSWVHRSGSDTGSVVISAIVGCDWTVSNPNSWITMTTPTSGTSTGSVSYTVTPNPGTSTRTGALTIGGQTFTVSQLGTTCGYRLSPTNRFHGFGAASNSISVTATSGCPWNVVNTNTWVTIQSGASGIGNGTVNYAVSTNRNPNPRTALLNIGGESFTITQWGTNCAFAVTPPSRNHGSGSETGLVMLSASSATCAWTVQNTNSWFTMFVPASGTGGTNIGYTVEANPTINPRSGSFMIGGESFTVFQAGAPCLWILTPGSRNHPYGSTTNTVTVTTLEGCPWTVENTNYWITVLSGGGSASGAVDYALESNTMAMVRSGTLTIGGQTFSVTQDPAPCTFGLAPMARSHGSGAEGGLISVNTLMGCNWSVHNTNSWITITSGSSGSDSGSVLYTVNANTASSPRSGSLVIGGQVFTVTQAGVGCSFSIAPTGRAHGSGSETGLVSVTAGAGCAWSVSNPDSWISITAGGGGSGNGAVGYALLPNPSVIARTGIVTIAGQAFTVSQAGLPCAYAIAPASRAHGRAAESGSIAVTTSNGCSWSAVTSNSWISITAGSTGSGSGTVSYAVLTNAGGSRIGTINVAGQPFTVVQDGSLRVVRAVNASINRGQTNRMFVVLESQGDENALGFSLCFDTNLLTFVRAVRGIDATNAAATLNTNLLSTTRGQLGLALGLDVGSGQTFPAGSNVLAEVWFRAAAGTTFASTPVTVCNTPILRELSDAFAEALPASYVDGTVTLIGVCNYALGTNGVAVGAAGGAGGVGVMTESSCTWNVSNPNGWITITSGASGMGNGTVAFTVEANPSASPRSGVLTIAGQTFTVNQTGAPCVFDVSPTNVVHGFGSETGMVTIVAAGGCGWTASNTNTWITLTTAAIGSGSATLGYSISANTSIVARTGALLVAGQTVIVGQAGAPCLFALTPTSRAHVAAGSTGLVTVSTTPGCPWALENTNGWVIVTTTGSGTGSGSFGYRAAINYFATARTGTVLVADQAFLVTQAGSSCGYSISPSSRNHTYQSGSGSVSVSANSGCAWDVINTNTWISIISPTNDTGSDSVSYTITANPGGTVRSGAIVIAGRAFTITQDQSPCAYAIAPTAVNHGAGVETTMVSIATFGGCAWSARTTNSWITVLPPTNGVGIGAVSYSVQANPTALIRTGSVLVVDQMLTVIQAGAPCTYVVAPSSRNHGFGAETNTIGITALTGCVWTVSNTNTWIALVSSASGNGTATVTYRLIANPTGLSRTGIVTVANQPVTISQVGAPCTYALSQSNRTVTAAVTTGLVGITTLVGCPWNVANPNSWIDITSAASGSGPGNVTYNTHSNMTAFARTGVVTIAGIAYTLTQSGAPCVYTIAPTNEVFADTGGTGVVNLGSITGCTWMVSTTNSWITMVSPTNGSGSDTLTYSVAPNPSTFARTGSVLVAGQSLRVTQSGAPCVFVLTPTNRLHEAAGGAGQITVTVPDGCAWTIGNSNSWIAITSASTGTGSVVVTYAVQANGTPIERTGVITIGGESFIVTQQGIACVYGIQPTSQILLSGNVTGLVSVATVNGCNWVTVNTNSWISIKAGESGSGPGLVRYTAAANPNPSTRVGFLTIAGQTFTVTQLGTPCSYTLSPTNRLHGSGSETGMVSVFTVMECGWNTVNTNSWITILSGTNGLGNGTVTYAIDPSMSPNDRTGYLTIGGQAFSIMQLGAPCTITLAPTNFNHGPGGETGMVSVTTLTGCTWTVTKTNTWITILSPTAGVGTGIVTYAVSFNTNIAPRSGVIRVGGQPYSITQTGMLCVWTLNTTSAVHGAGVEAGAISVTTSNLCPWTVANTNTWITFPSGTNFVGSGPASYVLAANPSPAGRFGTFFVAGQAVTVGQAGINCNYIVSPPGRTHGFAAETSVIAVLTSNLCQWTVVNTNSWITVPGPTNFSSSVNLIYLVAANPGTNARSGVITIASNAYSVIQIGMPFLCAPEKTVECGTAWAFDPPVPAGGCANTNYSVTLVGTVTNTVGSCGAGFTAIRTWQALDGCGASMSCTQMVRAVDTSAPAPLCAGNKVVECGMPWTFDAPVATDMCAGTNVTIRVFTTVTNAIGACGNTFTAIRIWEILDGCGNRVTCSQGVTVRDTTPPVLTCASNKTIECGAAWGFDSPTVSDACTGNVTLTVLSTVTNASGVCANTYTATRTWEAVDACTNRVTCSQTVTVSDTTPPVFTCPATKVVECGTGWNFDSATATDGCNPSVNVVILSTITNTAGFCGNTRNATRTWQATDACGNVSTCSQLVRVVDSFAPVIVCPPARTYEFGAAWNFDTPTVFDSCSGAAVTLRVVSTLTNTAGMCGGTYTATRTWDAADGCTNRSTTCSLTVRVVDTTPPVLTCPADKTVNCISPWSFDAPSVSDLASGTNVTLVIVSTVTNGNCEAGFTATRTWRATDGCTNSVTCSQTVTGVGTFTVAGAVTFATNYPAAGPTDRPVVGVAMVVSGATNFTTQTASGGAYSLSASPTGNITVTPVGGPTNSPAAGVSTVDISLIRRHVLNITSLDSPYKLLAGDVNGSASVSTLDISFIRRLILAATNSLPSGLWRYVPANHVFQNPASPWSAPTGRTYTNLSSDLNGQDFVAIKLGDVNNSWLPPANLAGFLPAAELPGATLEGSGPSVTFQPSRHTAQPGDLITARISASGLRQVTSAQGTLVWDSTVLRFNGLGAIGLKGLSAANFNTSMTDLGKLAFSWDDADGAGVTEPDGSAVFTLSFVVVGAAGTMSPLLFTDTVTPREVGVGFVSGKFVSLSGQVTVVETAAPQLTQPVFARGAFGVPLQTAPGKRYILEFTDTLPATNWTALPAIEGDGAVKTLNDPSPHGTQRFYRVRIE